MPDRAIGPTARSRAGRRSALPPYRLRQRRVQYLEREIHVRRRDAHGRLDAERIAEQPALAHQDSHVPHGFPDGQRLLHGRLLGLAVAHQLAAEHEAPATHVADETMPGLELLETGLEPAAHHA